MYFYDHFMFAHKAMMLTQLQMVFETFFITIKKNINFKNNNQPTNDQQRKQTFTGRNCKSFGQIFI